MIPKAEIKKMVLDIDGTDIDVGSKSGAKWGRKIVGEFRYFVV